ncbi:MAG: hypothetical protein ACRCVG_01000 [Methanobacteriaceae archaeon]
MKQVKTPSKHVNGRTNRINGMYTMNKKQHSQLVKSAREINI